MILPYLTSPTKTRCRTTPTPKKRGGGAAKRRSTSRTFAEPEVRQVRQSFCDADQDHSLRLRTSVRSGNSAALSRGSRLKIQAGCRPIWSWGANSWNMPEVAP